MGGTGLRREVRRREGWACPSLPPLQSSRPTQATAFPPIQVTLFLPLVPSGIRVLMASSGISPQGSCHPSLITLTFLHLWKIIPSLNSLLLNYLRVSSLLCQDPGLRQKLNFLLKLAQLNMVKLGLGILAG